MSSIRRATSCRRPSPSPGRRATRAFPKPRVVSQTCWWKRSVRAAGTWSTDIRKSRRRLSSSTASPVKRNTSKSAAGSWSCGHGLLPEDRFGSQYFQDHLPIREAAHEATAMPSARCISPQASSMSTWRTVTSPCCRRPVPLGQGVPPEGVRDRGPRIAAPGRGLR